MEKGKGTEHCFPDCSSVTPLGYGNMFVEFHHFHSPPTGWFYLIILYLLLLLNFECQKVRVTEIFHFHRCPPVWAAKPGQNHEPKTESEFHPWVSGTCCPFWCLSQGLNKSKQSHCSGFRRQWRNLGFGIYLFYVSCTHTCIFWPLFLS